MSGAELDVTNPQASVLVFRLRIFLAARRRRMSVKLASERAGLSTAEMAAARKQYAGFKLASERAGLSTGKCY
jgi:hypothetical protein